MITYSMVSGNVFLRQYVKALAQQVWESDKIDLKQIKE